MLAVRYARLLSALLLGLMMAASLVVLERLHLPDRACRRQRWTRRFMQTLCGALPYRIRVHGELPRTPMLWLSNHVSWADIAVLGQLLPVAFLSKDDVRRWPVAGWLASRAGTFFIRRGASDAQALRQQLGAHLQHGPVVIFPEGTTTDGRDVRTFHGRLLACAIDHGIAVQPVALRYLQGEQYCEVSPFIGDDDMLSHLRRLLRQPVIEVEIHLLAPIPSRDQERAALAHAVHRAVRSQVIAAPGSAVPVDICAA